MVTGITFERKEIESLFIRAQLKEHGNFPLNYNPERVIVLAGPTASGKTSFAIQLAEAIGGEIISADSMQVYDGMDIGTAKATLAEQEKIPHHLINIRKVSENFNVVDFYNEAKLACQDILNRKKVPIVVGGTGFYLHALIYGPPSGPPASAEVRKALEEEAERSGLDALYERLRQLDLVYAETLTRRDKQKIVRALEIIELTGKKVSDHPRHSKKEKLPYNFRCWLLYRSKESLYSKIEKRCEEMVAGGLLMEVAALEQAGLRSNLSASQAIGYRQALEFLSSDRCPDKFRDFLDSFKQASRNYAKRQMTWFRKESCYRWLDLDLYDPETLMSMIINDYEFGL